MERNKSLTTPNRDQPQHPPSYAERLTQVPTTFPIGEKNVHPLVNITEVQAHLRILGALDILKWKVQDQPRPEAMSKDDIWVLFVNRAVHRFYAYLQAPWPSDTIQGSTEATMPPLDVLMVWHSYLLNPRTYYEDSHRSQSTFHSNLRSLRSMPVTLVASLIEPKSLEPNEPSQSRIHNFESLAGMPYNHPTMISLSETVSVGCPRCVDRPLASVPWWKSDGKGFAQDGFKAACATCQKSFTKATLGVRRLCDELTLHRAGIPIAFSETLLDSFSGRIESNTSDIYIENMLMGFAQRISTPFSNTSKGLKLYATELGELGNWDTASMSAILAAGQALSGSHLSPQRLRRLCKAYSQPGPASVDLADAVIHQGLFIDKIVKLGWTAETRFQTAQSHTALIWSIARYHAFLWLMGTNPEISFIPTIDIDLAWHTHQLNADQYRTDTLSTLGMTPVHQIIPQEPAHGYDATSGAWRRAFNAPYSRCNCCPATSASPRSPGSLRNMMGRLLGGGKETRSQSPAMETLLANLSPLSADDANATHRSDHHHSNEVLNSPCD